MKRIAFPDGTRVNALGQGTWNMGDDAGRRTEELAALRAGIDLGMTLIDTAEMYGEGASEELVGEAIAGRRDEVFLVSKVYPHNASRRDVVAACERSLKRLGTDRLDLYLLHWRGNLPFEDTIAGFEALIAAGKIRRFGVSNLDLGDMREWWAVAGGRAVATNQILYNLARRGPEWDLIPWLTERGIPVMAYSPVEQARLTAHRGLAEFSARHGMTPAQAALAWLLSHEGVMAIPKAAHAGHVRENARAANLTLDAAQLAELDRLFAPPKRATPLEML